MLVHMRHVRAGCSQHKAHSRQEGQQRRQQVVATEDSVSQGRHSTACTATCSRCWRSRVLSARICTWCQQVLVHPDRTHEPHTAARWKQWRAVEQLACTTQPAAWFPQLCAAMACACCQAGSAAPAARWWCVLPTPPLRSAVRPQGRWVAQALCHDGCTCCSRGSHGLVVCRLLGCNLAGLRLVAMRALQCRPGTGRRGRVCECFLGGRLWTTKQLPVATVTAAGAHVCAVTGIVIP